MDDRKFYVYLMFRPNGVPLYVGKGHGLRINRHSWLALSGTHNNKHLQHIIRNSKSDVPIVILRDKLTEDEAFTLEVLFIKAIGREDKKEGPLVNRTDGGEGASGWVVTEEDRERSREIALKYLRFSNVGLKRSPETKQLLREIKLGIKQDPEIVERRVAPLRGRNRPIGVVEKIRQTKIQTFADPIKGAAHKRALCGVWITDGVNSKRIPDGTEIPDGWRRGRGKGNYSNQFMDGRDTAPYIERNRQSHLGKKQPSETIRKRTEGIVAAFADPKRGAEIRRVIHGRWITDGNIEARLPKGDPLPDGWRFGRIPHEMPPYDKSKRPGFSGIWITNGVETKRVPPEIVIPEGWHPGRAPGSIKRRRSEN